MRILLADDDEDSRSYLAGFISELGHEVVEAQDGRQAWQFFETGDFHLVLSDIRMPGWTGLELLQNIRQQNPRSESDVILFTAYSQIQTAVEALRSGAYDYLLKPVNIKELVACLDRVEEHQHLKRQNLVLTHHFEESIEAATQDTRRELEQWKAAYVQATGMDDLILASSSMKKLYAQSRLLHQDPAVPVLIEGETGTGKEILARYIHYGGEAVAAPFIDINCAAIPAGTFESELFGYEPGTFTGALPKGQKGKLDLAQDGTLFLDEISEMPPELQAKLLRIVQEREFYRMGGLTKYKFNARIVSATNVNIMQHIDNGLFRKDLFYRLGTAQLHIPPLREHREDILPLAHSFLARFVREKGRAFNSISPEAETQLVKYDWPGNIRELKNVLERAILMNDGLILKSEHLHLGSTSSVQNQSPLNGDLEQPFLLYPSSEFRLPGEEFPLNLFIDRIIASAVAQHNGNITHTARYLGISRRSLDYRLHKKES
ncbi:MAG TPA: sigma-54 dependent transcriptional regulator [Syntrophomonadaceae bacterium]|nr:sigma-54 dependent transcriptional regulator [Syntrophomonadaceae bacterium]